MRKRKTYIARIRLMRDTIQFEFSAGFYVKTKPKKKKLKQIFYKSKKKVLTGWDEAGK